MSIFICSFSTPVAELKPRYRDSDNVLDCLRRNPRVSCFDLGEHKWLRDMLSTLERAGHIAEDKVEPYPYVRYKVIAQQDAERPKDDEKESGR